MFVRVHLNRNIYICVYIYIFANVSILAQKYLGTILMEHHDSDISGDDAVVVVAPLAARGARRAPQCRLHGNLSLFFIVASCTGFWFQAFEKRSESDGGLADGHWWQVTRIVRIVNQAYLIESPYTPRLPQNHSCSMPSCSKMIFGDPRLPPK
jgi:hypothetical protein